MHTFRRISLLALGIITVLCVYAASQPDSFRVERNTLIHAPVAHVFDLMNDLQAFSQWSPYTERDPAMQKTFGAITVGPGASYTWNGNKAVGAGRMEITQSQPLQRVVIQLDFTRPIEAHNLVVFSVTSEGGHTRAAWAMEGPMPFLSKLMSIFLDFDAMVGNDFSTGLEKLKVLAEQPNRGGRPD